MDDAKEGHPELYVVDDTVVEILIYVCIGSLVIYDIYVAAALGVGREPPLYSDHPLSSEP